MNSKISLRIHSIKCVDETGGWLAEKAGNDEIDLSGFGIDANANTTKVNPFRVYSNFDAGDIKKYSPPQNFVTLNLGNNGSFPKTCSVGFVLAEIDSGDFSGKITQIFDKLKELIDKKKKEEEDKKRNNSSLTSGTVSLTGAEVAIIWTVVKPIVFGWIKDKIIGAANDDIFLPRDVNITIPNGDFTWNGSKTSPPSAVEFRGHDGIYLLTYDWVLS